MWKAFCETIHLLALGLWAGALGATGAFAASTFPIVRAENPRLPAYEAYAGEHWRIMAGKVVQRGFFISDIVQFVCALLAVATFGAMVSFLGMPRRNPTTILRALALSVALACAAGTIIIVAPQLNAAMAAYWAAAAEGHMEAVAVHRAAVDRLHPIASRLMGATFLCVLTAFVGGLWAVASGGWRPSGAEPAASDPYPEPALARGRRA